MLETIFGQRLAVFVSLSTIGFACRVDPKISGGGAAQRIAADSLPSALAAAPATGSMRLLAAYLQSLLAYHP